MQSCMEPFTKDVWHRDKISCPTPLCTVLSLFRNPPPSFRTFAYLFNKTIRICICRLNVKNWTSRSPNTPLLMSDFVLVHQTPSLPSARTLFVIGPNGVLIGHQEPIFLSFHLGWNSMLERHVSHQRRVSEAVVLRGAISVITRRPSIPRQIGMSH